MNLRAFTKGRAWREISVDSDQHISNPIDATTSVFREWWIHQSRTKLNSSGLISIFQYIHPPSADFFADRTESEQFSSNHRFRFCLAWMPSICLVASTSSMICFLIKVLAKTYLAGEGILSGFVWLVDRPKRPWLRIGSWWWLCLGHWEKWPQMSDSSSAAPSRFISSQASHSFWSWSRNRSPENIFLGRLLWTFQTGIKILSVLGKPFWVRLRGIRRLCHGTRDEKAFERKIWKSST
jgi:hypothetical protein